MSHQTLDTCISDRWLNVKSIYFMNVPHTHTHTRTLPRLLAAHHPRLGTPLHPPVDLSPVSSSFPFLLFHTCSTTRQIMQQDCQLGIPPPSPCLAFLSLSLLPSLCFHSFSLAPSLPLLPPLLSWCHWLLFSRRLQWRVQRDDTQYLKAGTGSTHQVSPSLYLTYFLSSELLSMATSSI